MPRLTRAARVAAVLALPLLATPALAWPDGVQRAAEYETGTYTVPLVFPVLGGASWSDNWLACRSGCTRKHMGQDLMAPKMRPLVAACDGEVGSVKREATVGEGNLMMVRCSGRAAGFSVMYIHVNNDTPGTDDGRGSASYAFMPGVRAGQQVFAGQQVGWVGDSGNAESTAPHLHFELHKGTGWQAPAVNAAASLRAAQVLSVARTAGPHTDGLLVAAGPAVWLLDGGMKRGFSSRTLLETNGYKMDWIVKIQAAELATYPTGPPVVLRDGRYRDDAGVDWIVRHGERRLAADVLGTAVSLATGPAKLAGGLLARVPIAAPTPDPEPSPDPDPEPLPLPTPLDVIDLPPVQPLPVWSGQLFREGSNPAVWYVDGDERRWVPDVATLKSHGLGFGDVWVVPPGTLALADAVGLLPDAGAWLVRDGTVLDPGNGHKYLIDHGRRRDIHPLVWQHYGLTRQPVLRVSEVAVRRTPAAPPLP